MAGKPELSATPGVQNVVVYVSNDNFAQAYTVNQQNVGHQNIHNGGYTNVQHSMAPLVSGKPFTDKHQIIEGPGTYNNSTGYFTNQAVISQNGVPQNTANALDPYKDDRPLPLRPDVSAKECSEFTDSSGYIVMGGDGTAVRCESVRSETAESSCSSLSSADEGIPIVPQPDMVVYDHGVNVRHGVVVVGGPSASASAPVGSIPSSMQQTVVVPFGWKRLFNNGGIIYFSPNNTALSSVDQVKEYLLTPGTCKCGLECPLKFDSTFNFDPKVIGKPWTFNPDTNTGDLTKLCNHKRKMMAMSSLGGKPPDACKLSKEHITKKKRKACGPYAGIPSPQMFSQREKIMPQPYNKENGCNPQIIPQPWAGNSGQPQALQEVHQGSQVPPNNPQFIRYHNQERMGSPVVVGDSMAVQSAPNQNISHQIQMQHHQVNPNQPQNSPIQIHHQHILTPNGQIINQMPIGINNNMVVHGQNRILVNQPPSEPSGPGRPVQVVPMTPPTRPENNPRFCNQGNPVYQGVVHQYDPTKNLRPYANIRQNLPNSQVVQNCIPNQQKVWNPRIPLPAQSPQNPYLYERVPPLHQHQPPPTVWQDDLSRKKVKHSKSTKKRSFNAMETPQRIPDGHSPCPNIDVREIPNDNRPVHLNPFSNEQNHSSSPSFMEDPSGYLAQQTALLNSTISRQTGVNGCSNYACSSPVTPVSNQIITTSQPNRVPLPSNIQIKHHQIQNHQQHQQIHQMQIIQQQQQQQQHASYHPPNMIKNHQMVMPQFNQVMVNQGVADSSVVNEINCQGCRAEYQHSLEANKDPRGCSRPNSQPSTPSSSGTVDDPVTSSNYMEKHPSPDSRPIQGGTVSTSNVSPIEGSPDPSASHTPTPPHQEPPQIHIPYSYQHEPNQNSQPTQYHIINQNNISNQIPQSTYQKEDVFCHNLISRGLVTTMASGRTVGSNTITSVLAGRANTATVSMTNQLASNQSGPPQNCVQTSTMQVPTSKSPLEMVQSVVSSIKVPHSQQQQQISMHNIPHQVMKQGLPPGHILVSSGGQLLMASTNSGHVMPPPPPPKIVNNQTSMPPISVSPMITNVTGSVSQMIPAVAQQVLGQQTVLVNALQAPFVLQPGVTMTMDGMNMQIPQLVTGNVIQQQIQIDNSDPRRLTSMLSPENKKKNKKRKVSQQTVASMLHIAAQQNSGVVGFPQQIQMAHSPQGITTPVMQALTIVPGKGGGPPQIVMNGQIPNTQSLMSSQSQQINLLQPVNLAQSMVQNFPTIQQFVLPNLAGMVMNADGTATIVQDTSNLGMQLQLQNVNGQNVLTQVQNNQVFTGGQSIIPTGMVIRPQGKIIQQQHSPGAQFLSPNGTGQFMAQFNGQLSPLVANVSPGQQVTFSTAPQQLRANNNVQQSPQEYIQCGQTLMVPANIAVSSSNQNTTFVQQNTTIVQQQTTMLSNNQGNQNQGMVDQNFILSDKSQPVQAVLLQQRGSPVQQLPPHYRHSVSTQTAVHQNGQPVTTNTFCQTSTSTSAGSPPDTTTHSPLAPGGQSPPTADTTTHTGSTDDALSPTPSNCSGSCSDIVNMQRGQQCSMAMVHCISSSEPDSAEMGGQNSEFDWRSMSGQKIEFTDISRGGQLHLKKSPSVTYAESSTMMHFVADSMKQQEAIVSSRNYEKLQHKRKHSDTLVVMETRHMHSSLFEEDDERRAMAKSPHDFVVGDLVWAPFKGCPAWPGKLFQIKENKVRVHWFGSDKNFSEVDTSALQTLSEGLDAHHRASKRSRTSRKLNTQLEKAIQEAMMELDKMSEENKMNLGKSPETSSHYNKKSSGRLRSSQR